MKNLFPNRSTFISVVFGVFVGIGCTTSFYFNVFAAGVVTAFNGGASVPYPFFLMGVLFVIAGLGVWWFLVSVYDALRRDLARIITYAIVQAKKDLDFEEREKKRRNNPNRL